MNKGTPCTKKKKKRNLDTAPKAFTQINSKWIIELNIKCKCGKLLKDNSGKSMCLGFGDDFLDTPAKA